MYVDPQLLSCLAFSHTAPGQAAALEDIKARLTREKERRKSSRSELQVLTRERDEERAQHVTLILGRFGTRVYSFEYWTGVRDGRNEGDTYAGERAKQVHDREIQEGSERARQCPICADHNQRLQEQYLTSATGADATARCR